METLMKILQLGNRFNRDTPRSLLGSPIRHHVFAVLLVLAIAAVTIASAHRHSIVGSNLILAPGQPGLEPALY
jgi:hypothetical protein